MIKLNSFHRKLREKDASEYHIQLCCALIGIMPFCAVEIGGIENYEGCITVLVLMHYFTLVAVMWMGAEALFVFQKHFAFSLTKRSIIITSFICWGTLIMTVLTLVHIMNTHIGVPFVLVTISQVIERNYVAIQSSNLGQYVHEV